MNNWRTIVTVILVAFTGNRANGQGTLTFATRVTGNVDARVTYLDGTPVSTGFRAQLYAGPEGSSLDSLTPLLPITTFQERPAGQGYVNAVGVTVPGVAGNSRATVMMRAFNGATWDTSSCRAQSQPIDVLTGFAGGPPAYLTGLQPFSVDCIPEPGTLALVGLAAGGWCLVRWRGHLKIVEETAV